ncbi:hypothetical protein B0T19DRAFT_273448 [Cercophora scortea]|uniref:Uncharacterized protein n=1 Tax=Cercophora scortea TaxID=314031 RepID=A0AAE0I777_9PEZI|nr:hypothetical protein B0T19DRAFT_273448 [Cercophora scortea]
MSLSYKRLRVMTRDDIERTYPLIIQWVKSPSLALLTDEFAFTTSNWPSERSHELGYFHDMTARHTSDEKYWPNDVDQESHDAIVAYIHTLGLSAEGTKAMVDAFEWKRKNVSSAEAVFTAGTVAEKNRHYAVAATAVLVSLCKHITTLHLGGISCQYSGVPEWEYFIKSNYGLLPKAARGLQHLKRVEFPTPSWDTDPLCHGNDRCSRVDILEYLRGFHRLPAIESLIMNGVEEYQSWRALFPPATSSLTTIRLTRVNIPSETLATIIRVPRRLEEFTLTVGGLSTLDGGSAVVYPKTLGKCLLAHKDTLRVLDLDFETYSTALEDEDKQDLEELVFYDGGEEERYAQDKDIYFDMDVEASTTGGGPLFPEDLPDTRTYGRTIGSLHDFSALRRLSISVNALLGRCVSEVRGKELVKFWDQPPFQLIDALPSGLEFFCLYEYRKGANAELDEHVAEFMEKKGERLPQLREVRGVDEGVESVREEKDLDHMYRLPKAELGWVEA